MPRLTYFPGRALIVARVYPGREQAWDTEHAEHFQERIKILKEILAHIDLGKECILEMYRILCDG
jgi:hypothetical protein